jgi:hypothetical protein
MNNEDVHIAELKQRLLALEDEKRIIEETLKAL